MAKKVKTCVNEEKFKFFIFVWFYMLYIVFRNEVIYSVCLFLGVWHLDLIYYPLAHFPWNEIHRLNNIPMWIFGCEYCWCCWDLKHLGINSVGSFFSTLNCKSNYGFELNFANKSNYALKVLSSTACCKVGCLSRLSCKVCEILTRKMMVNFDRYWLINVKIQFMK